MAEENRFFLEGMTLYQAEKYEEAAQLFTKALNQDPMHVGSLYQRGLSRMKLRDYKKAIQDFDEAINFAPQVAATYSERGVAQYQLKNYKESLDDLDKALEIEPENAYRYASRAYIRAGIGDKIGALNDYRKALEINPNDAIVQNNLGLLEESMGYSKKARERYEQADRLLGITKEERQARLDKIIAEHKEAEASRKANQEPPAPVNTKPQTKDYLRVIKSVFTSKESFGEFVSFVKGKLGQKKENSQK